MIKLALQIALILGLALGPAVAQMLHGVTDALSGGGTITVPCAGGTIDLSTGCVQPMLGVM